MFFKNQMKKINEEVQKDNTSNKKNLEAVRVNEHDDDMTKEVAIELLKKAFPDEVALDYCIKLCPYVENCVYGDKTYYCKYQDAVNTLIKELEKEEKSK